MLVCAPAVVHTGDKLFTAQYVFVTVAHIRANSACILCQINVNLDQARALARAGGPNALFLFAAALDTSGSVCGPKNRSSEL